MLTCSSCGHENPDGAKFCMECATTLSASASSGGARKIISALFCDLVGSTTLGEQHDPEVLRPILDGYFTEMSSAVERHGGRVQKFIGDAVVAVFGLPSAHEDDALRAVRAGIEMQERLQALNEASPIALAARIGITTGEVLVPGDGKPIVGDAMNTASRLQSGAEPGQVLIGEPTFRLVRDAVVAEAVEPVHAKGKVEPVPAFRVQGVQAVVTARAESPLVGRDRHLAMLEQAMRDAVESRAPVLVTILAAPGVGKSRLAAEFRSASEGLATVLVGQTPSYGDGVTFAPLVELLSEAAGRPGGEADEVAERLRERLVGQPDAAAVGDRLAQVLGVGDALASDASWAVRRLIEVLAAKRPLVVVLEDIQWAEAPMLDLTDAVIERVHGPVLFLCLARPELLEQRPTWAAGKPRALTTTLPPLSTEDARRVAGLLLGPQTPAAVVDRVCQAAEGNPLYLEQLTAMLADQGLLVDGRWVGSDDADVDIPETLQALLASRLDRLDPTPRLILERSSVEGRRFRIAALRVLAPELSPGDVETAIASLEKKGLVQPEDEAAGRWRFAHALVLEAAYRGLSKQLRADLHVRLADWMIEEDADQADVDESVARHLERALHLLEELGARDERSDALSERAGELFAGAGSRAFATVDYITSRDLLGRAAALLPTGSPRRLDLVPYLGMTLAATGLPEEAELVLSEGVEQARSAGSERDALRTTVRLLANRIYRSPTDAEIESAAFGARAAVESFESMGDDAGVAETALALMEIEYMRGRLPETLQWTSKALRHALAAGRPREATEAAAMLLASAIEGPLPVDRFAVTAGELSNSKDDPISRATSRALLAAAALAVGDDSDFREQEREWREVIDRNGLSGLGAAQSIELAIAEIWAGNPGSAERRLREAREILAPLGFIWWVDGLDGVLCAAVEAQDRPREFLRLADAFEASVSFLDRDNSIRRQLVRARAHLIRGSAAEADVAARHGLELAETSDLVLIQAEALLTLADVLDARDLGDEAAAARRRAIAKLQTKGNSAAVARLSA